MKKILTTIIVLLSSYTTFAQQDEQLQLNALQYWWDGDTKQCQQVFFTKAKEEETINFDIDTTNMPNGMHSLYYKVCDNQNNWSPVYIAWIEVKDKPAKEITKLRYWWGKNTVKAVDATIAIGRETEVDQWLSVPDYAKQDELTGKGIARFNYCFIDDRNQISTPEYIDVIYSRGPELSYTIDNHSIILSWTYSDDKGIKDYNVYCSEDDGPYVLLKAATTETTYSMYKTAAEKYKFLVTARNSANQSTSFSDEWSVVYENKSK